MTLEIDPQPLLQLVSTRRMFRRFGVLLRHYWLPATELIYEQNTNGQTQNIVRNLLKCDSDLCVWHEGERLHIYNRSEQTFRTQGVMDFDASPQNENDARIQAFLHVPILTPLLPIPLGFQWHVPAENGYMNFTLESETVVGTMPVVFVRRQGRFVFNGDTINRTGVTAVALDRSVILEDRVHDVFPDTGSESTTVLRLICSRESQ